MSSLSLWLADHRETDDILHRPALTSSFNDTTISSRSDGPRYDAAYLSELKASTVSLPKPQFPNTLRIEDVDMLFDASEMAGALIENLDEIRTLATLGGQDADLIPSESAIKAAREKRDRLRKVGPVEEDFISLEVTKREPFASGPHPESRLVREDDEMGEGEDGVSGFHMCCEWDCGADDSP